VKDKHENDNFEKGSLVETFSVDDLEIFIPFEFLKLHFTDKIKTHDLSSLSHGSHCRLIHFILY
jgi:hypothetical protein